MVWAQGMVKPSSHPQSTDTAKGKRSSATAKSPSNKGVKRHHTKAKKQVEIVHTAPDQQKIDSIKKEKLKHKK
jgi:hypothetical protein